MPPVPYRADMVGATAWGAGVAGVDAMVFEQYRLIIAAQPCRRGYGWADAHAELRAALLGGEHQWLVAMFLRPECPSNIFTTGHHISALVVKTNDRLMASHLRPQGSRLIFCQIHPLSPLVIKA